MLQGALRGRLIFIHARLIAETGGEHGVRDIALLLSALGRPQASFEGRDLYPDVFSKAAALVDSLIRNHAFVDGNKRTGITAGGIFLRTNGYTLTASNPDLEAFTLAIAQSQVDVEEIAAWLKGHTNSLDSP